MVKDIYFTEEWQKLYADRGNLDMDTFHFECQWGNAEYIYAKRPIIIDGTEYPYYDIVTPYAFSGPLFFAAEDTEACHLRLVDAYEEAFDQHCQKEHIIAEYVQFNPWLHNSAYLEKFYDMDFRSVIVGIDLTKDIWNEELHSVRRRSIRKAWKSDVEIVFDEEGKYLDEFLRLYDFTVKKYDAVEYYRFSKEFIDRLFKDLKGRVLLVLARREGRFMNATIVLKGGEFSHGFLAGNDPEASMYNGNSLVLYEAAIRMQNEGHKAFILGGGEGTLTHFKDTFTKDCYYDYYAGKRIRNQQKYDEFTRMNGVLETKFFPAYRDNGKVKYKHWEKEDTTDDKD